MNIRIFSLGTTLSLFGGAVFAAYPTDLMYNNKPINALCFYNLQNDSKAINLKTCGSASEKYVVKGQESSLTGKGFIGFNWQSPDSESSALGYSYYRFFNAGEGKYWVYTLNNGGGTGEFSTLLLAKRKDNETLEIQTLTGGDRCNGGLRDVSATSHDLQFGVNLTAYDLVALSKQSLPTIKAYNDLAACAVCCVAKAVYQVSPSSQPQLSYVKLEQPKNAAEMPEQGTYQTCFNQLFISYVSSGKTEFKPHQLDEFVDKFNESCIKKDKQAA